VTSDIENFAFDASEVLIKSNQNKWVILGHELTENNVRK
jgi:hypothetical protein